MDFLAGLNPVQHLQKYVYHKAKDEEQGKGQMYKYGSFGSLFQDVRIVMIFVNDACRFRKNENVRDKGKKKKPRMTGQEDEQ